jgi:hypothetical protein
MAVRARNTGEDEGERRDWHVGPIITVFPEAIAVQSNSF